MKKKPTPDPTTLAQAVIERILVGVDHGLGYEGVFLGIRHHGATFAFHDAEDGSFGFTILSAAPTVLFRGRKRFC